MERLGTVDMPKLTWQFFRLALTIANQPRTQN